jgi:repressor LexA
MTERQEEILSFIHEHQRVHGIPPSTRGIQRHFQFGSQTTVMRHLRALAEKNVIEQLGDRSWGTKLKEAQTYLFELSIYGTIPAGMPSLQEQQPKEKISIDPAIFRVKRPERLWGLEVSGDSMIDAHILPGDIAVLERREAKNGDIVAALVDDNTVTLKRLVHVRGKPVLRPENKRYRDIIPETRLEIQGVLVGLIGRAKR